MKIISNNMTYFYATVTAVLFFISGLANSAVAQQSAFSKGSDKLSFAIGSLGKGAETGGTLVSLLTTIAVSLAFFFFFWNLFQFIRAAEADSKEAAQGKMVWSLVAIIVIVSLWGIIAFVRSIFGIDTDLDKTNNVLIPTTEIQGTGTQRGGGGGGSGV